jgi:hypothetical protein
MTETLCPACSYPLQARTAVGDPNVKVASPGDVTLCFRCGEVLVFGSDLTERRPTKAEMNSIRADEGIWALVSVTQAQIRAGHGAPPRRMG